MANFCLTACGSDDDGSEKENVEDERPSAIVAQLGGTKWSLMRSIHKSADGSYYNDLLAIHPDAKGATITFLTDKQYAGYKIFYSYRPNGYGTWHDAAEINYPGDIVIGPNDTLSAEDAGTVYTIFGAGPLYVDISGDVLTLRTAGDSEYEDEYVYQRVSSSGDEGGSSSDKYEKPELGLYDFTQIGKSSLKVDYVIFNADEIGFIKSARIDYGKTSSANERSVSANIVGDHVIATISGLSSNTDYYFRCTVRAGGGSSTTSSVKFSLSAW